MKRLLVLTILLGVVATPAYASIPLLGCQMTMPIACCPVKDCGDCHMKPLAAGQDQEVVWPSHVKVSFLQAAFRTSTAVPPAPKISKPGQKDPSGPSESPGPLYDLYSDYRL